MSTFNTDSKTQQKRKLEKNKLKKSAKSDSDSDEFWETDETETLSESTASSGSSYKPKNRKGRKTIKSSESENESLSSGSSSESSSDSSSESVEKQEKTKNETAYNFQQLLSKMFPSKYIDEKMKNERVEVLSDDESKGGSKGESKCGSKGESKDESTGGGHKEKRKSKEHRKSKPASKSKPEPKPSKKSVRKESDHEDSESSDTESEKKDKKKQPKSNYKTRSSTKKKVSKKSDSESSESEDKKARVNIILLGGEGGMDDEDWDEFADEEDMELMEENENEECDSEDEKMFMKEKYEKVEPLPESPKKSTDKNKPKKSKHDKKSKNSNKKDKKPELEEVNAESEYIELLDLKKHLTEQLKKKPNSKILKRTIEDCNESIRKLVTKSRTKNTKSYYELISGKDQKYTSEIEYFKKKLSNKEQLRVMSEMKEINSYINIDKPYRLTLLDSNIPANYKATVMQKLNILRGMEPGDPEYYKMKKWIDGFMRVPFGKYKSLSVNMSEGIDVCSKFMCEAKSKLDNCVYGLDDAKIQILQMVGQWVANPSAMGTAIAIKGPMGTGKCHTKDTPIMMYDGTIRMVQDVMVGDLLMGDDSTPREVLALGKGTDQLYDVEQQFGDTYGVNSEHILCLKLHTFGRVEINETGPSGNVYYNVLYFDNKTNQKCAKVFLHIIDADLFIQNIQMNHSHVEISVKDYLELPEDAKPWLKGYHTKVNFPSKPVPVDPYTLGLWLATVNSSESSVRTPISFTDPLNQHNSFVQSIIQYRFSERLYIPEDYKINDIYIRRQILAGIIDTCSQYSRKTRAFELTLKNSELTKDILFIARTIGLIAHQTVSNLSYLSESGEMESFVQITITGNLNKLPCKGNYAYPAEREKYYPDLDAEEDDVCEPVIQKHSIHILPKGVGEYYGFMLDDNCRYVLGDCTVTHNTTLVKEGISQILGREFAFIALGGTGDSSFLEGHSYTYEGSTWGKILQILIDSKCMNPVIYFDELDKISETARGDEINGILTHLTDTTQNNQFHDKYFSEIDFDLSKCLFIFSYNDESKVNPILKDRMYRIQTKGYVSKEKLIIARKYLLPKIREQVNFNDTDVIIPDETLQYIVSTKHLTHEEAGVRNLKRCLEIIHTKLNLFRLVHSDNEIFKKEIDLKVSFPMTVTSRDVDILIKNEENQNQSLLAMYV